MKFSLRNGAGTEVQVAASSPTASTSILITGWPLMKRRLISIKVPLTTVLILYLPCSTVRHRKLAQAVIINSGIRGASLLQRVGAQQSL